MAMFVHLTPMSMIKAIQRNGIGRLRQARDEVPAGIFAVPLTRNFYQSHQWLRELKRRRQGPIGAVYFRIADSQVVWVGHYNGAHRSMSAAAATTFFNSASIREGYQVVIPRRIEAKEIHRVRSLPQMVGWRYYPGAHGKRPCGCPICQRGGYGARRIREAYERS
jgi:hypothetical protein